MHKRPSLSVTLLFALASGQAMARQPTVWSNSAEAVRQYEQATLESLREHCTHLRSDGLMQRPEISDLRNGFISQREDRSTRLHYSLTAYDKDRRSFVRISGQQLKRDARLTLPLALPRDYSYCRIVRDAQAHEYLELSRVARNDAGSVNTLKRLHDTLLRVAGPHASVVPAEHGRELCTQGPDTGGAAREQVRLLSDGAALVVENCPDSLRTMGERAARLLLQVFGQR